MSERKLPPQAWKKGQSGNIKGKPKGARNHATRLVLGMMETGAAEIAKVIIDAAKGGDLAAAKMVLERLAPPMRERPVQIDLPETVSLEGCANASNEVLHGVASGQLLPSEGATLAGIIETRRRTIESVELEQRITALEERAK